MLRRLSLPVLAAILVLAAAAIHGSVRNRAPSAPSTATQITAIDVGQGDAILIDGPGDAEVLIDGGPTPDLARSLGRLLGPHDRTIDLMILTHPHADHLVGLVSVLTRYDIRRVLLTGVTHTIPEYERFLALLRDRGIPTDVAIADRTYDVGSFHFEVLSPFSDLTGQRVENLNSSSIVAMLTVAPAGLQPPAARHPFRMLLTGDAEADVETALLERHCADRPSPDAPCPALAADVLKVAHHGSQDSSSPAFLTAVHPVHAIMSVGVRNRFHHPHPRTLKRLARAGVRIWRTDRDGDVTVTVDPEGYRLDAERR